MSYAWLDELPVQPGPPDLRMGLRNVDPSDWLRFDALTIAELALKAELLAAHDDLILLQPGHDDAATELLAEVEAFINVAPSGHTGLEALRAAALLAPEDQCLMARGGDSARTDGEWRLIGGSVIFGNQWNLAEKLGGTLSDIHGPTEGYEELLATKVRTFFDNLRVGRVVARRNWFVHDIDTYHQPTAEPMRAVIGPGEAATLFIRSERETLRRLPKTDVVVFTIKTQIAPLDEIKARPGVAAAVAAYLDAATPRGLRAKDAEDRHVALATFLRS